MPEWNIDQSKAITTTDKGVVVSAAAGSGKTAVLVERTIRILADPVNKMPADKLLAVTFTVDAASQLRRKLSKALSDKLAASNDRAEKKWLRSQQERLPLARISTINSFCLDLVKRNLNEFEFEEGVRIIDDNDAEMILKEAFDQALEQLTSETPEKFELLYSRFDNSTFKIIEYARELYSFLRSLPFPEKWFSDTVSEIASEESIRSWLSSLGDVLIGRVEKALKLIERIKHNLEAFPPDDKAIIKNKTVLAEDRAVFEDITSSLENNDWNRLCEACGASFSTFSKTPAKNAAYPPLLEALFIENGELRDRVKKEFSKISDTVKAVGKDLRSPLAESGKVLSALHDLVLIADDIAHKEKLRSNVLEFSDVEIMSLGLLVKNENGNIVRTPIANELIDNSEFRIIMIDEFQDVNDLQELIFKALSNSSDPSLFGNNVFVVGDVKQSIYSFRLSNPKLFINAKNTAADSSMSDMLTLIELKNNYRSREAVIDFVNLVFSQLMSVKLGEVEYSGGERLVLGASYPSADHPAEVIFVDDTSEAPAYPAEEDDEDAAEENVSVDRAECMAIAKRIRQLIDEKAEVFDTDSSAMRPCRPSDFCVLYRSGSSVSELPKALQAYGLHASAEKTSGYLRSREISIMISLLKIIDDPMRDIPMAAVMLSPVMGFTADELARIRIMCRTEKYGYDHLYQIISSVGQKDENAHSKESAKRFIDDPVLEKKCIMAKELISKLSFYSAGMSITRLIRRIYNETELLAAASAYENSKQTRANLCLLLEYATAFQDNGDGSVAGFVRYLTSVSETGKDLIQAVTSVEDRDSVIVKTIHGSKGLEYPFVFMCGITKHFNEQDLRSPLLLDEYSGAGLVMTDRNTLVRTETLAHAALKAVKRNKLLSEELRLLYVAFTRARERLFIPINFKRKPDGSSAAERMIKELAVDIANAGGVNPRIVRECNSYLGWIAAALLCCKDNAPLLEKCGIDIPMPVVSEKASVTYTEHISDSSAEENKTGFYKGSPDSSTVEQLLTAFLAHDTYPPRKAASKMTVTEITSAEKELRLGDKLPEFYPQLPKLSDELGKLSASRKGTLTHLFMEIADYPNAEKSVRDELARLTENGFFSEKEASNVYVSALENFFSGELYQRMKSSPCIMREKKFLVSADELSLDPKYRRFLDSGSMLQGVADCIFLENNSYVLVDYKTDKFSNVSEISGYSTQLELYKAALELILDAPVKACYIYSFTLNKGVEIPL